MHQTSGTNRKETPPDGTSRRRRPPARQARRGGAHLHLRHRPHPRAARSWPRPASAPTCASRTSTDDELVPLRDYIEGNFKVEGDLRREVAADIRRKVEIGCYQGIRHRRGLPVRGQRTHTNARTRKGPRKDRRRQEEGRQEVVPLIRPAVPSTAPTVSQRTDDLTGANADASQEPYRRGAKKVRRKEKKNVAHGHAHIKSTFNNTIVSITDPPGGDRLGLGRPGRLQGLAQVDAVRRADGRRGRRPPGQEHGMKKVDVFVKGPGSGRETAIRSLQATGLEVGSISGRHPVAAQRLPPAQAPPRLTTARRRSTHGSLHRPGLQACRREKMKLFLKGAKCESQVPDRDPSLPARRARPRAHQGERVPAADAREAEGARIYGVLEKQFRGYYEEANRTPGQDRREPAAHPRVAAGQRRLPRRLRQVPRHGPPAGPPRPLPGQRPQGRHPALPRERERHHRGAGEVASS